MIDDYSCSVQSVRERAKRLREIADRFPTDVSPQLRQMADELDEWANHFDLRRKG